MLQLIPGGFLKAIAEDSTPVLGGDLDGGGFKGTFGIVDVTDENNAYQIDGATIVRTGAAANHNVFLGRDIFQNDEGIDNVGIGFEVGYYNSVTGGGYRGTKNVYIGYRAGKGDSEGATGDGNVAIGPYALENVKDARINVVIGYAAARFRESGSGNFALGWNALRDSKTGNHNIAIGNNALRASTDWFTANVAIGAEAGEAVTGINNVFIGYRAGHQLASGHANVFLGYCAGENQTLVSSRLIIDNQDRGSAANEAIKALIYGLFAADPADQDLTFNANVFLSQVKSGPDQATAGAAAGEIWRATGWEGAPGSVLMIGL